MSIPPCDTSGLIIGKYFLYLNDIDLGATVGQVSVNTAYTYAEAMSDQSDFLYGKTRTSQLVTITATMQNMALDKLRAFLGIREGFNGTDTLCWVEAGGCSTQEEFTLDIRGPGPGCSCRNFHFPRVVITPDNVDVAFGREEYLETEIEFTALASCPADLTIPPSAENPSIIGCMTDACDMIATDLQTQIPLIGAAGFLPNYVAP